MQTFAGLDKEAQGGMTMIGRIIRDAWVFGILPEGDNFAGRSAADVQQLSDRVHRAWDDFGQLPSRLPPDLAQRHARIHAAAIEKARAQGWNAELGDDD
jgi:hypothetical protein